MESGLEYDDWIFPGNASPCEFIASLKMQTTAAYAQASIRAHFFLRLKMRLFHWALRFACPYRMYDGHTPAFSHAVTLIYFSKTLRSAGFT